MGKVITLDDQFYRQHITFTSVPLIIELARPLAKIGLNYFTFDRTYQDGSHSRLTNAGKWIEDYYRKELYKKAIFEKDPRLFATGYVFWSWLNREPIYSAAAEHDIDHGMTIIEKHESYTDFFHFGTSSSNLISPEELVSKLDILYRFIACFKEKAINLIHQADTSKFKLFIPHNEQIKSDMLSLDLERDELCELLNKTEIKRIYLGEEFKDAYLTKQEIKVLWFMKEGQPIKVVAKKLNLSTRTLESHLKTIRRKLGCNTLFKLGYILGTLGLKNIYPFKIQDANLTK